MPVGAELGMKREKIIDAAKVKLQLENTSVAACASASIFFGALPTHVDR